MKRETEIDVHAGPLLVGRYVCTLSGDAGETRWASWRGMLYPLRDDGSIDVGVVPAAPAADAFTVVRGEDATWVLLQGMPEDLANGAALLGAGGLRVLRSGRWLGEPVGQVAYDWFVRCAGDVPAERITALLDAGGPAAPTDEAARVRVLEQEAREARARLAELEAALRNAGERRAEPASPSDDGTAGALEEAWRENAELKARLERMEASADQTARGGSRVPVLREEVDGLIKALRPDVTFLRDSLRVAFGEFSSRESLYRAVSELPESGARPDGWKDLKGQNRWWERHVSDGRDDTGRAYARFDRDARRWDLLIGWKSEQARDIDWIARR